MVKTEWSCWLVCKFVTGNLKQIFNTAQKFYDTYRMHSISQSPLFSNLQYFFPSLLSVDHFVPISLIKANYRELPCSSSPFYPATDTCITCCIFLFVLWIAPSPQGSFSTYSLDPTHSFLLTDIVKATILPSAASPVFHSLPDYSKSKPTVISFNLDSISPSIHPSTSLLPFSAELLGVVFVPYLQFPSIITYFNSDKITYLTIKSAIQKCTNQWF